MHIQRNILDDKIKLFVFAGIAKNEGSGWDYAIPQGWCDELSEQGIDHPAAWFAADCTGPGATPVLHHIGEAYVAICNHRSKANQELWPELWKLSDGGPQDKALYQFIHSAPDNRVLDEADAGFLDMNFLIAAFNHGWTQGSRSVDKSAYDALRTAAETFVDRCEKKEILSKRSYSQFKDALSLVNEKKANQFLVQSAWRPADPSTKSYCFVIRTKEHAMSGTDFVVHMMTDDGGFHHGYYTDSSICAMENFLDRCKQYGVPALPKPLVNETH